MVIVVVVTVGLWGALRQGPAPEIAIGTERPALGAGATRVQARFSVPKGGLGAIRLELTQGDRTVVLAERAFPRPGAYSPLSSGVTNQATLEATAGRATQDWLKEGEATLRATADRMAGPLRSHALVVAEKRLAVLLRPPRLELLSRQHYVRQGGAGVVVFRVGATATRSGVRAGEVESLSFPLPGGQAGDRFCLFAIPWQLGDGAGIRLFAEDDAGNRVEQPFVDLFKPSPPFTDTITLTDEFLQRVVPAIESETPGLDTSGSLLDRYLRINGGLRKVDLAKIAEVAKGSQPGFLWSGAFEQMPDTERRARFAENRTYVYGGKAVDHQTHLGLDLASNAHAPVPAANSGTVLFAGWLGIYGNAVIIDHGYGLMSLYGHMSSLAVKPGDAVNKGQTIGASGATGLAGGDHLHLEIFLQGHSVDPMEWLDAHWIRDNIATKLPVPGIETGGERTGTAAPVTPRPRHGAPRHAHRAGRR